MSRWLGISALVILLDQWSKSAISSHFVFGEGVVITGFFNLVLAHNMGASFSMLNNAGGWQRWLFSAVAVIASIWIIFLLRRHAQQKLFSFSLSFILGGALGNLIDRIRFGFVVDFLDFHWNEHHFAAFNLADSAITCGAALLLLDGWIHRAEKNR
jgi:signal peptidase II